MAAAQVSGAEIKGVWLLNHWTGRGRGVDEEKALPGVALAEGCVAWIGHEGQSEGCCSPLSLAASLPSCLLPAVCGLFSATRPAWEPADCGLNLCRL